MRFGIADTGDTIVDSGLFVDNFTPTRIPTDDDGNGSLLNISGTEEADELVGNDDNQFFEGLGGNDTINPGGGDDLINGGIGDDLIVGGNGKNILDGGDGNDTVTYAGNQADFTIEANSGVIAINNVNNLNFTDTLTNIETIEYADISISTYTFDGDGIPVYRFFRNDTQTQFYTTDRAERDSILKNLPQYELEGISFVGAPIPEAGEDITGISPVYRFLNTNTGVHFYTADEAEKAFVEENLDNYTFEGTPYYGYDTQVEGTVPLYRFYNAELDAHFYTPSIEERDFWSESPDYRQESSEVAYYVESPTEI